MMRHGVLVCHLIKVKIWQKNIVTVCTLKSLPNQTQFDKMTR